jgi:hypothetical protein
LALARSSEAVLIGFGIAIEKDERGFVFCEYCGYGVADAGGGTAD